MTNKEIVDNNLQLIQQCVDCQFANIKDKQYKEDFFHDLIIILYTYPNDKMNDAFINGHLNALVTRIIQNNVWSRTSRYYKDYNKFQDRYDDISEYIDKEEGGTEEW